ncbi:protein FAR1-RELATED SEQUENCE 7-like [Asparagus officinalis]|uniref:protein FAR1-RELATED SEQUENCE 7-like n=1 Tax=Asparagus officinalis TaxID=4686 RepID=UPI00098E78CB|nr:protein FAR1-RELATED SEQUENCE 7-like [Asparagus officinalis]
MVGDDGPEGWREGFDVASGGGGIGLGTEGDERTMNVETDDVLPIGLSKNYTQNFMDVDGELHIALVGPNEMTFIGEAPYEGKEFATLEEAYNYYNSYAKKMGFGIRKETADKSRKTREIISQVFVCNKAGRKRLSDKRDCGKLVNRRPDTRVDCKGIIDEEYITAQQCIDHIRTIRKNNIGNECISIIKNFQDRKEIDPEFYFSIELDQSGTIRSVFWTDGRSRSSYLSFGDVVVFDVTYKTNHLSLPFAPFTGVNHHRQSILFGCALLADEQEDTFIWLFTQWLKCMHGVAPKAIITDQDAQIGGAIKQVFPNTRHRFCSWHIGRHIAEQQLPMKAQ